MSDFDPRHYDQYGNRTNYTNMNYDAADGRGPYILLAILVVIGVIGGILYFNHPSKPPNEQQAQAPASDTTKLPKPMPVPGVGGATPTHPSAPATMPTAPKPPSQ